MAKISPVAAKYIVQAEITIEGVVDRPDVIGAIFGQTEGLLGNDLELRELQRSGRIGRIEVNVSTSGGKTRGEIIIPSSLDKTETAIIAAALEIIQRIGPCNAKINTQKIEDVRTSKRQFVIKRAKELLRTLTNTTLPDSQEISYEVAQSVRMMEVVEFGKERIAAGPAIEESDEIIVVEGRADVLNLLKHGFKNVIAMNGTSIPQSVKELTRRKTTTVFVDGDRGGNLIIRELLGTAEIDFVCKAPDGKEVEELTKKEIHKSLRGKITAEQSKLDLGVENDGSLKPVSTPSPRRHPNGRVNDHRNKNRSNRSDRSDRSERTERPSAPRNLQSSEKKILKQTMEDLFGTRGACIFDQKLNVLGKVPLSELRSTMKSLNGGIYAVALDGEVDNDLASIAEKMRVSYLVGSSKKIKGSTKITVLTDEKLV